MDCNKNRRNNDVDKDKMLLLVIVGSIVFIILFMVVGCSPKIVERVETKIEYRDRVVHDTATFEVPVEVEKIVTRDTVSRLENNWAKSDAIVSDGFLHHSLESKPKVVKIPVEVTVRDTVWKEATAKIEYVKVPAELSWWQTFKIRMFWWLFSICIGLLFWTFGKPLLKLL